MVGFVHGAATVELRYSIAEAVLPMATGMFLNYSESTTYIDPFIEMAGVNMRLEAGAVR